MGLLNNKTAIVFGASGKLGVTIARVLFEHGAKVAVHYLSNASVAERLARELDPSGNRMIALQADSTDECSLESALGRVKAAFGAVDIAVNAIHGAFEPVNVEDSVFSDWSLHLNALKSHYLICKTVLPEMRLRRFGRIIFVSAAMAVRYVEGCSMYTAVKRGLNGFCHTVAIEEGRNNITVNIVAPGGVSDAETQSGGDWDEMTEQYIKRCALGRFATAREVANTVVYFASPLADGITGQTLYVSGGEIMN